MAAPIPRGPKDWGYAIYRIVYTPESDALWPSILSKLDAYVYRSIWYDQNYNPATPYPATRSPFDYAAATPSHVDFKNIIMSDPALYANKSIDAIANFFSDYLDAVPTTQRVGIAEDVCLVIDEEVLWWLRDAPGPAPPRDHSGAKVWIKAVDVEWSPDEVDDEIDQRYKGWALVPVQMLRFLHGDLCPDFTLGSLVSARRNYDGRAFRYEG